MGLLDESLKRPGGRRGPALLLLFLVLTVGVVNASTWLVLSRATRSIDDELGRRLTTVASAAITTTTPELLLDPDVADDAFVRTGLEEIARRHDLEDVFLLDPEGVLLFDLSGAPVGDRDPFLDRHAFAQAAAGEPAASPAVTVDGVVLKAGYAPVEAWDGTVEAVLGVTAGGGFSAQVPALRRTLLGVSLGSGAIVALLAAVFFGTASRLARTEAALARSETLGAMGMMAAGVAHEIRNPLSIISGSAARLKKKYGAETDDELFDFIPEEVDRLNRIIEGYLRFARDEPLAPEPCDLRAVVERSARLVEEGFAAQGITLRRRSGTGPVPARVDPHRIQQVLLNLLLNGAQAMPGGGDLDLALDVEREHAVLRVSDRGRGLTAKERAAAFEPFYTTKEKGSGLGLVMAKRIVEAHHGSIAIENRDGGGATVTVTLPRGLDAARGEEG